MDEEKRPPFFVSREWRGRLTVETMRLFPDEEGVMAYLRKIEKETISVIPRYAPAGGDITKGWIRVYQLFAGAPPKNMTKYFREKLREEGG